MGGLVISQRKPEHGANGPQSPGALLVGNNEERAVISENLLYLLHNTRAMTTLQSVESKQSEANW